MRSWLSSSMNQDRRLVLAFRKDKAIGYRECEVGHVGLVKSLCVSVQLSFLETDRSHLALGT